jgi:IS605 OrfB family transposase
LIAEAVVSIAQAYQASSVVLPDLSNIREIIVAEVQALAEQKVVGCLEGQKQYAKRHRENVHRWSYSRLAEKIQSQAAQIGIGIEQSKQSFQGTPQEKAKNLAIAAYSSRRENPTS